MRILREWLHRLGGTLRLGRPDSDLEEELQAHLELAAADARRRGDAPHRAERAARVRAGGVRQAAEAMRDQRGVPLIDDLARDLRYGLRMLRRSPAFTAIALLTLALGIGANTAAYQILDAIRLRPLAVENPHQLAIVELADLTQWNGRRTTGHPVLTNPLWEAFKKHQTVFSGVLAWANVDLQYGDETGSHVARGLFVSGEFFNVLRIQPLLGRLFTAADDSSGCGVPGAVVSHVFWRRHLGGDPAVVGKTLVLNARPVEVIGVTPPRFSGLEVGRSYDVAVPICSQEALGREQGWLDDGTIWWLTVMGRVASYRSLESVNAELEATSPGLFQATVPPDYSSADLEDYVALKLRARPGSAGVSALRRQYGDPLVILLGTTALVLLMACTNLANLIVARGSARGREFAVRLAVGASRGRVLRQVMVENGLLAIGGAAAGLALARVFSRLLVGLLAADLSLDLPLDARVIVFVLALALLTCLTFGLIPAWRASRLRAYDAMKASARTLSGSHEGVGLRQILVVSQVALSLVLVFGALLFTGTLRNLLAVDAGFEPDTVVIARVDFSRMQLQPAARTVLKRELLDRIRSVPGVSAAAEVRHVPMGGTGSTISVWRDSADPVGKTTVRLNAMSDGYFRTMGITLVAGRDFTVRDSGRSPRVAIANHALVRRLGIVGDPVGQRFRAEGSLSTPGPVFEIIGVVPDTKYLSLREDFGPIAFVPIAQIIDPRPFTDILIRPAVPFGSLSANVRRIVAGLSPAIDTDVRPFAATIRDGLQRERLMAALSGFFGVLAALIAAIGVYGVMSYLVLQRTNEIGVRLALGARQSDILTMVLRQGGRLLVTGLGLGAPLAIALAGYAQALVFGLRPHDVGPLGLASALLAAVAICAGFLPALRAALLDPVAALRQD